MGEGVVLGPLISMAMGAWGSACSYLSSPGSTEIKLYPQALSQSYTLTSLIRVHKDATSWD